jgi:two-component system alkaline phosphatase synthesis response regulator PhoP
MPENAPIRRKILLIEDEEALVMTLTDRLVAEGFEVASESDGDAGYRRARAEHFDLIVLDVALPGRSGLDLCRDLRRDGSDVPILMLTARVQVSDRVVGLKLGADDYLTKPFDMMELLARIEALLRRGGGVIATSSDAFVFGEVSVDFRKAEVQRAGVAVELSALELKLLRYFIDHKNAVLSREELLDKVWGYDATPFTRTVDVHVASIRQKLERHPSRPQHIVTVHGSGYKFVA